MFLELLSCIGLTTVLMCLLVRLVTILQGSNKTNPHPLPPSPGIALPILGHLYLLETNPRRQFTLWGQRHGPLLSLYLGNRLAVVLYGFDTIKEAFVKHADIFSDRPKTFVMQALGKDKGFVTSGPSWRAQRKVTISILQELGLGTSVMEEKVQEEISRFLDNIDTFHGQAFNPRQLTMHSVSNIICALVFGSGFRHDDPEIARYTSLFGDQLSLLEGTVILNFLPILRMLPGDLFGLQKTLRIAAQIENALIKKQLELRKKDIEAEDIKDVPDFLTGYIREIRAHKAADVNTSPINEENLVAVVANLFAAGTETTSTTICWALLYLVRHPEVTDRCFQEMVEHVGLDRRPTYKDRQQLKYMEATVMEVQRISSITPFSLHHTASRDIVFRDYLIPKGTIIMPSLDSILLSSEIWGDPLNFRPGRFLDATGQSLVKREEFVPFCIGRRSCLGEALAKMELFLFLSTMIQKYHFRLPEGAPLPTLEDRFGLSCTPLPYKLCFIPRAHI
ncbi:unnamed protein product [Candidula unifasciata]|uniref:Cytochrome P450 n=1 Tax=Candidula unifasciata TaxID=100452 RepID=A0A8S3Z6U1_9EUPU|nr:unnamed protein product [Candidula unifasciata]